MKKDSLKDWFKFQVWRQSGGTLPELCDLSEIREWLNETADDPDLAERISIVETAADKARAQVGDYDPSTTESTITDDLEQLQAIVQTAASGAPVAPVAATASLAIDDGISLVFTARTAGAVGNDISVTLIDPGADSDLGVIVEDAGIAVTLAYAEEAISSSLADIKTAIEETPAADALVAVSVNGSDATIAIAVDKTSLANGADGTVGAVGALRFDSSKLYVSVEESTTAVSNWKYVTLT